MRNDSINRLNDIRSQLLRFFTVGGVGFFADSSILILLTTEISMNPYAARVVSFITAVSITWYFNRVYTFNVPASENKKVGYIRYFSISLLGGIVNWSVYGLCLLISDYCYQRPVMALVVATSTSLVFNFTLYRNYVFNR